VTKEFYLESRTKAEALSFADIDKPWGAGSERFHIDPLGHEEDLGQGARGHAGEEVFDFGEIVFG
jgi:hypothetical protein